MNGSPRRPRAAAWVFVALASLCAASAGFFAAAARWPRPLPPQAYVDSARGFSVTLPPGWRVSPVGGSGPGDALVLTDEPATISVSILPPAQASGEAVARAFNGTDAKILEETEESIDGSAARRFEISGGRTYSPPKNAGKRRSDPENPAPAYESLEWKGALVVLRDGGRDLGLKFWSERSDFETRKASFDAFAGSLRRLNAASR